MGDIQAAVGFDRLPWLADEADTPAPRTVRRGWILLLGAGLASLILAAGAIYWLGADIAAVTADPAAEQRSSPPVTIPLPAPREATPQPEVAFSPPPQVEPVAAPPPPTVAEAPKLKRAPARSKARAKPFRRTARGHRPARASKAKAVRAAPVAARKSSVPALWPVRAESYSSGRLVRIGRYTSARKAKRGWHQVARAYPGMKRLPALVVPVKGAQTGRTYYRLQMGTTSQAHSEVLCQRAKAINLSCVVLDIPRTRR